MSSSPSPIDRRPHSTPITSPARCILSTAAENAVEVISIPSAAAPKQTPMRDEVEKAAVTSIDEQTTEPAAQDSTQEKGISAYTEEDKNEIKENLSQHFGADDKQETGNRSEAISNNQAQRPSSTPNYRWKIEEARRRREQARTRNEKRARVSQQNHSNWSAAPRNISPTFVLFEGQQCEFCPGCLLVIGLMQMPNIRICPTCRRAFICEQCQIPL